MDIISMARELGKAVQNDERFIRLQMARTNNDDDEALQTLIGEFNLKRMSMNAEMSKEDKSEEKAAAFDAELKELYAAIMSNPNMTEYTAAQQEIESVLKHINTIITLSANGEDPDTVELSACGEGCSSCSGCH